MKGRQLNRITIGLAWLASLGAVFVLGILSAFAFHLQPGADPAATGFSIEERELGLVVERMTGSPADLAALKAAGTTGLPESIEQTIRAVLRLADAESRSVAARTIALGLPSRQLMASIRMVEEMSSGPARNAVLEAFLQQWGSKDGRSAIAFATSLSGEDRDLAVAAILRGWSRSSAREAWSWVVERYGTPRRAQPLLEIILTRVEQVDRGQAIELLESLPASPTQSELAGVLIDRMLLRETPRSALNWLNEMPRGTMATVGGRIAAAWSRSDPEAAAEWFTQSFPRDIEPLHYILREWCYRDAASAADWVWREFRSDAARRLMDTVAEEWVVNEGPTPLAVWLNTNGPGYALDGAIEVVALATATMDPATALIWAQSISDDDSRALLEIIIARDWLNRNPGVASRQLPNLLETETARNALLMEEPEAAVPGEARPDQSAIAAGAREPTPEEIEALMLAEEILEADAAAEASDGPDLDQ